MVDRLDIFGNKVKKAKPKPPLNKFGDVATSATINFITNKFGDRPFKPTDDSILLSEDKQLPSDIVEDPSKFRNAYFYSRNLDIDVEQAYNFEEDINRVLYGENTNSASAWAENKRRLLTGRRKGPLDALKHGGTNAENLVRRSVAGMGREWAEAVPSGIFPTLDAVMSMSESAMKWMWDLPEDFSLRETLVQASDWVSQDIKDFKKEHPETGFAIDPDIGFTETLKQMVSRPENMIQGLVEAVPLVLEGALGTAVAGPVGGIVTMASFISGDVYQSAREEGTDILPAFAQAIATGTLEAVIEQWTLGRKIVLGKNFGRFMKEGGGRKLVWEGIKAFFRGTAEEGSQEFNRNFWQWLLTDRSQQWFEGVKQAAAIGGPLEAAMSGVFAGAGAVMTPVDAKEAQRRLTMIKKAIRKSGMSTENKNELLDSIEKAEEEGGAIRGILTAFVKGERGEQKIPGVPEGEKPVEAPVEPTPQAKPEAKPVPAKPTKKAKVKPTKVEAEEVETPEEAKLAEERLKAEEGELVSPNLYIGNVTKRMKEKMSSLFARLPEDVRGFTEKGFPTKRTNISMTRAEAEQYLAHLEDTVARKLTNIETIEHKNKFTGEITRRRVFTEISNDKQQAEIQAEWGDIAALRKSLGVPVGKAPFRIHRPTKTRQAIIDRSKSLEQIYDKKELKEILEDLGLDTKGTKKQLAERLEAVARAGETKAETIVREATEKVTGKTDFTIETTKKLIDAAVRPQTLDESKMTVGEVLRAVMKRSARTAKMAYAAGRRELRTQLRAKARAKKRINTALKTINQKLSPEVDFHYREAIEALRMDMDLKHRSTRDKATIASRKEYLKRATEEQRTDIPTEQIKQALSKPLDDFTIEQLEETAAEVQKLIDLGKKKRALLEKPEKTFIANAKKKLISVAEKLKKINLQTGLKSLDINERGQVKTTFNTIKLWTWSPKRLFNMLDGGDITKSGWFQRIFWDDTGDRTADMFRDSGKRIKDGMTRMKELGLSTYSLSNTRRVKLPQLVEGATTEEVLVPIQELMGIYVAAKNQLSKLVLRYGFGIDDTQIKIATEALTEAEIKFADYILEDYDKNYPRLRKSHIAQTNEDAPREENYSPIRRVGQVFKAVEKEVKEMMAMRRLLYKHNVSKQFTKERVKNIPAELQTKMRLDVVSLWEDQATKQERYIHLGPQVHRMHSILKSTHLRKALESRFGESMLKRLDKYVDAIANPYIYKQFDGPEKVSAWFRRNATLAYLGLNLTVMGRQTLSNLLYLPAAGPSHLLASAIDFAQNPMAMVRKVWELDPIQERRSVFREIEEMRGAPYSNVIMQKLGKFAMEGIKFFDMVAVTIGWNAVYERALAKDKSPAEAIRLARDATASTQPTTLPQDIPELYRSSEYLNWFTMFTRQLNQIFGIVTYDMPSYLRNEKYAEFALQTFAMSMIATMIWMIANRRLPEEPKDFAEALSEQFINSLPLIGKPIMASRKGWDSDLPVFASIKKVTSATRPLDRIMEKDWEFTRSETRAIAEGIAVSLGIPYTAIRRGVQAWEEEQPTALLGARRPSGGTVGRRRTTTRKSTTRKSTARR